jgi:hypothetical protein
MPLNSQIPGGIDPSGMRGAPFDPDELRRRSSIQTTRPGPLISLFDQQTASQCALRGRLRRYREVPGVMG